MTIKKPKFMENKEWYYNDETQEPFKLLENMCWRLTDKAPKEAVESYLPYCTQIFLDELGYVPKFVIDDYNKYKARFK